MAAQLHVAWDEGLLSDLGVRVFDQKTIKTLCGKTRTPKAINNTHPTCPECETAWIERAVAADEAAQWIDDLHAQERTDAESRLLAAILGIEVEELEARAS